MKRELWVLVTCDRCGVEAITDQGIQAKDGLREDQCGFAGHWIDGGGLPHEWSWRTIEGQQLGLCGECADKASEAAAP